jgi:hypothetical protein
MAPALPALAKKNHPAAIAEMMTTASFLGLMNRFMT